MAEKLSIHDQVVYAAKNEYETHGKNVWINPNSEKNKTWNDQYIDVIATENEEPNKAWVIEIETEESVSQTEAENQWIKYDNAFTYWHLSVPTKSKLEADKLIKANKIEHCEVITWESGTEGKYTFSKLPGLTR